MFQVCARFGKLHNGIFFVQRSASKSQPSRTQKRRVVQPSESEESSEEDEPPIKNSRPGVSTY